jgi:PAS domain S-box-containing protein
MNDDKMMENLFETISIPLFIFHAHRGDIVLADRNGASRTIAVCEPGQTTGEIFKKVPQIVTDIDTCFSQKKNLKRELFFTQADGRIKYFRFTVSLLSKNFLVMYVHDLSEFRLVESELRKSKERLELAIFATDAGLWDWNIDSGELLLSAEWCAILGYTPDDVNSNISFWENLIHPEDRDRVMKQFYEHLQGLTQRYQTEHRLKCKTGQWKWMLDTGKVVERDINGKALRMIGTKTDITRRMEMEQEIKYLNSKLEKRVEKRTLKLKKKESSLIKSQQELRNKSLHLEEVNNALQVLMEKNNADKKELQQNLLTNIEIQVLPFLDKIETSPLSDLQRACLGIIRSNLQEMAAPFSRKLISSLVKLTPAQVKIANFIRQGKSSKEMADLLFLSSKTIETQRRTIRKKLGITQKKINLRTYLESL